MDDTTAQSLGFTDAQEFFRLFANADISTPEKLVAFRAWQSKDRTKDGLLKLKMAGEGK